MEEKKIDRKKLEIIIITVATILIAIFSVTYGFFQDQIGAPTNANVNIGTGTPDDLRFNVSKDISINVNQFNFGVGAGNQSDSAVAIASLIANSTYNTATYTYYVYFKINTNEYIYTTTDNKPEIILTVTDPNGNPVTAIDGLTYVQNIQTTTSSGTTQTVSGFDITTATGTFAVASNYTITSNSSTSATTQNWNFTATFINLETDQADNTGKTLDAEILIQQNELQTLADYVISQYTGVDGENGLYYHDADLANGAGDNSYRYAGANPNNYVCFGSDAASCPSANLYRIIGVFGSEVKLIKSTSYGSYVWNSGKSNTWDDSTKPDIYYTLNETFLKTINNTWQNKIATHAYKVGGMSYSTTNTAKQYYNTEVGSSSSSTTDSMKIGLMYVSDFGFAASPDYWTTELFNYEPSKSSNWLAGLTEWTISRSSGSAIYAFRVSSAGYVRGDRGVSTTLAVRPVFYLNSSISYVSGSGSSADPIRIN